MIRTRLALILLAAALACAGTPAAHAAPTSPAAGPVFSEALSPDLSWSTRDDGRVTPALAGARSWSETGRPVLAVRDLLLAVPAGAAWDGVEIVPLATRRERAPAPLALGDGLVSSEGVLVDTARLPADGAAFPAAWGEFGGLHSWRGFRLAAVRVFPVRAVRDAAGAWSEVEVLERYEVRPRLAPGAAPAMAERERLIPGERAAAEAALAALIANPQALAGYQRADGVAVEEPEGVFAPTATPALGGSAVRYLIVTTEAMASSFQALADHRTSLGLPAVVKTVEWIEANYRNGADLQETIRIFLREAYARWGVEYLLLGGDTDVLPARYATSTYYPPAGQTEIPADLYFGCLDGNWNEDGDARYAEPYTSYLDPGDNADLAEEVYVGRATVSTAGEAAAYVAKLIGYERQAANAAWPNRALFAAEVLFPSEYVPGGPITTDGATFAQTLIDSLLIPCTDMEYAVMYEAAPLWPGSVPLTRAALIDSLNTGHYGIVDQIGHGFFFNMSVGDANFTVSDADALTNHGRPFLLYALNCASAAYDYSCLMERFTRHPTGGAFGAIGAARAAFPFTANDYQQEFFRLLWCDDIMRVGAAMSLSKMPMLAETFYNTADRWTVLNYVLLGDPATPVWNGRPAAATVTAPTSLAAGAQTVNVTVTSGGSPVAGAHVALSKLADDYAWGTTDAAGHVALSYTPVRAGAAKLTVSGSGLAVFERDTPVTIGGAYIALDGMSIVDNGANGSSGNGDGRIDAGETVALWPTFRDNGAGGALNCAAVLGGGLAGLTVLDANAAVGNVPAGGTKAATDPFLVQAAASVPDGSLTAFTLTVTAQGGGTYRSEWSPVVVAPEVVPVALTWSDVAFGNGNGVQDAGERVTVAVRLKNYGAGLSGPITARLRTADPAVTLYDTTATYTSLALLQEQAGSAVFSLSESDLLSDHPCWIRFSDQYGRVFRHDFNVSMPGQPSTLSTDSSQGPDIIVVTWPPVTTPGLRGYHVYRSTAPAGPFTRANTDLVERTSYYRDTGLAYLTQYYYKVAAVDSSLVEGPASLVVSQSTAPPEKSGFPLPVAKETSGHGAVGDVDGDGYPEIVVGADEVYVWTAGGGELRDGDGDAQTFGPFTDLNTNFSPAGITLADLDGQPGLEIIASDHTNRRIYVLRADGSNLPGWPRTIAGQWNWTTPAVGDVDGDGDLEIVFNGVDGRTHAFHHNGTELINGDNNASTIGIFLVRSEANGEYSFSSPALADLDGDGKRDIIFGSRNWGLANYMYAYRYDRNPVSGFPFATGVSGRIACSPSVGDVNGDGSPEIVFLAESDSLYVLRSNGRRYPGFPVYCVANSDNGGISSPSPALADFNGDGYLEIVAVGTVGGASASLRVYSTNTAGGTSGQMLSGWPRSLPGNSESSPVVGDVDGDGVPDILHGIGGGDEASPNNLYAYRVTGALIPGFPITLGGPVRPAPTICDLDLDGQVDIVYAGWDLQVHVWSMPAPYNPQKTPWPTFRGGVIRDGVYGRHVLTDVPEGGVPAAFTLAPNYPNPFNPQTTIRLLVPGAAGAQAEVRVRVYDLQGRLVRTLHEGSAPSGWNTWVWDGRDQAGRAQASGVYFLRAQSGGAIATRKMALVK